MKKAPIKTIYYRDELNDDFSGSRFPSKKINGRNFRYIHTSRLYRLGSWLLYYFIAAPIAFIVTYFGYNVRVNGRNNLRSLRHQSYFLYGNHTHWIDMATPYVSIARYRRVALVANPAAVGTRGLGAIVNMLGILPLAETYEGKKNFLKAMQFRLHHRQTIAIFPEAHIWPFYTDIRPFSSASFAYPVNYDTPVVAMCSVFKKARWFAKYRKPRMVIYLSEPMYPNKLLNKKAATQDLRDRVYQFMKLTSRQENEVEYYRYIKIKQNQ